MAFEFKLPELGENVTTGDVVNVLVHEGDVIAGNDGVLEIETDKAVIEIPCPQAGKIAKVHVAKGDTITVGQLLMTIEPAPSPEGVPSKNAEPTTPESAEATSSPQTTILQPPPEPSPLPAGPETRRLAREMNVDLSSIQGSGRDGRITVEDVRAAAAAKRSEASAEILRPSNPPPQEVNQPLAATLDSGNDAYGPVRRERMSKIWQTIATQMSKSASVIPHVTIFNDADVTDLDELRKSIPTTRLGPEVKLSVLTFVLKAVASALRRHPLLNASIDEANDVVILKQYINIGVAVDTPRGLVVPVIRNIDKMHVLQIANEVTLLASRARLSEFAVNDLRGGTFTVSNLGSVGGVYATPIINHPEVAILLLGRSRWLLGRHKGQIKDRLLMPLSLSFDHRVVDGATASRFLNEVIGCLESPGQLLLPE
jgi:pyruvate/2-oxoglutarate dehydrogenase complex dihydrolipoamide acyltransferase (E2) component